MSTSQDLEMQLVVEPDESLTVHKENSKNRIETSQRINSATAEYQGEFKDAGQFNDTGKFNDTGNLKNSGKFHPTGASHRKWSDLFSRIDPIFYTTCVIFGGLLVIGFSLFFDRNNKIIVAHLREIESANNELREKIARSGLSTHADAAVVASPNDDASIHIVKSQSLRVDEERPLVTSEGGILPIDLGVDPLLDQASLIVEPASLPRLVAQDASVVPAQRSASSSRDEADNEIVKLRMLLAEKEQQLEVLALENHELRVQLAFGSEDASYSEDVSLGVHKALAVEPVEWPAQTDSYVNEHNSSEDAEEFVKLALAALADQNTSAAEQLYLDALQRSPNNREANLGVAALAKAAGNINLAVDRYRLLLKLSPDDHEVFSALLGLAAPDNLIETELLNHVSKLNSGQSELYSSLGHYFGRSARWEQASSAFKMALDSGTNQSADILFNLAVSFEHLGQLELAVESYMNALATVDIANVDRDLVHRRLDQLLK